MFAGKNYREQQSLFKNYLNLIKNQSILVIKLETPTFNCNKKQNKVNKE